MGFDNVVFPTDISYGSAAGPGFKTKAIELEGGGFERLSAWSSARHKYEVKYGIKSFDDLMVVKSFFLARGGSKQSFLFKDWQDYATNSTHVLYRNTDPAVTSTDQPLQDTGGTLSLGFGDGNLKEFQLVKEYVDSVLNYTRNITKPKQGTILISVGGTTKTEGTDYTINYQTGVVTFTTAPGSGVTVKWGGEFYVPVFFDPATDEWLGTTFTDFSNGSLGSIALIEDKEQQVSYERAFYGGAKDHGQQTGTILNIVEADGIFQSVEPLDANVIVKLPSALNIPTGGPVFFIQNKGSFSLELQGSTGGSLIPGGLPAGKIATVYVGINSSGTKYYAATGS